MAKTKPKIKLFLGKNWFHATRPDPTIQANSSIPGNDRQNSFSSMLLNGVTGGMCCVGKFLQTCGVSQTKLSGIRVATNLGKANLPKMTKWLINVSGISESRDAQILYAANDGDVGKIGKQTLFTGKENKKEFKIKQRAIIKKVFARHNVKVVFED